MIRLAEPEDARALAALLDAFNREFDTPTPGPAALTERLGRLLALPDVFALQADEPLAGLAPTGLAWVTLRPVPWDDGPVALLDELYVVPEQRNAGVGSSLLAAAEAEVRRRGARFLEINVDGEDHDARRFYERHGYLDREPGAPEASLYYFRELG